MSPVAATLNRYKFDLAKFFMVAKKSFPDGVSRRVVSSPLFGLKAINSLAIFGGEDVPLPMDEALIFGIRLDEDPEDAVSIPGPPIVTLAVSVLSGEYLYGLESALTRGEAMFL